MPGVSGQGTLLTAATMMVPLVSIIIPCYNSGQFLAEAVASAIGQTHPRIEVVVADDGSTDRFTQQEVRRLARRHEQVALVLHERNQGLSAARNTAIRASHGEFIVPLDADDRLHPTFVARTLPLLRAREDIVGVYTDSETFGCETNRYSAGDFDLPKALAMQTFGCSILYRRRDFDRVGGYFGGVQYSEEWDFLLSLLELGMPLAYVPEPLFYYRQHAEETMTDEAQRRRAEILQMLVARHRALFTQHWSEVLYHKDTQIAGLLLLNRELSRWQAKVMRTIPYRIFKLLKQLLAFTAS